MKKIIAISDLVSLLSLGFSGASLLSSKVLGEQAVLSVDDFSTNIRIAIELDNLDMTTCSGIRILKPGCPCSTKNLTVTIDSAVLTGCAEACATVLYDLAQPKSIDVFSTAGTAVDCDEMQQSCKSVSLLGAKILNATFAVLKFNDTIEGSVKIGDRITIDASSLACANSIVCNIISGTSSSNGQWRSDLGNRVVGFESRDSVALDVSPAQFDDYVGPGAVVTLLSSSLDWRVVNRWRTRGEIMRLAAVRNAQVCVVDADGQSMFPAGSISFTLPGVFGDSVITQVSFASGEAVPGRLLVHNVSLAGDLRIVLPFTGWFDIACISTNCSMVDGQQRSVACSALLKDVNPVYVGKPEKCWVTVFKSLRKEFVISFIHRDVVMESLILDFISFSTSPDAANARSIMELHVISPENPYRLVQFGEPRLGFIPIGSPDIDGSHWMKPGGGLQVFASSSDLRFSNNSVSMILAGASLESQGIKNGTHLRIIGWNGFGDSENVSVACSVIDINAIGSIPLSCAGTLIPSVDNISLSLIYSGPVLWGSRKTRITFSNLVLPDIGFWPMRFLGELSSPNGGLDVTWSSERVQFWCSPIKERLRASFINKPRLFVGGSPVDVFLEINLPWSLIVGASFHISVPKNILINQTVFTVADFEIDRLSLTFTAIATSLDTNSSDWSCYISNAGQWMNVEIVGPRVHVLEQLTSTWITRINQKQVSVRLQAGIRSALFLLRKTIIIERPGEWLGRRVCSISPFSIGENRRLLTKAQTNCVINTDGQVQISLLNWFLEPNSVYRLTITVPDEMYFKSGYFGLFILDHTGSPLEGISGLLVGFPSMVDGVCARAKLETNSGLWIPNMNGSARLYFLKVRPDTTDLSIDVLGLRFPPSTAFIDIVTPVSSDQPGLVLTCIGADGHVVGNTLVDFPKIASIEDVDFDGQILSFRSNFIFSNLTVCSTLGSCITILVSDSSTEFKNAFNVSGLASSSIDVSVDSCLQFTVNSSFFQPQQRLAQFSVSLVGPMQPEFLNQALVSFVPPASCSKCNIVVFAPFMFEFPANCTPTNASAKITACIGNLNQASIFPISTLHAWEAVNITVPIRNPTVVTIPSADWLIRVGEMHSGILRLPSFNLAALHDASIEYSVYTYRLAQETNSVLIRFSPYNGGADRLFLRAPRGFSMKKVYTNGIVVNESVVALNVSAGQQVVRVEVLNPLSETDSDSQDHWEITGLRNGRFVDFTTIIQRRLHPLLQSLTVYKTGSPPNNEIAIEFATTGRFDFGDNFFVSLPYACECSSIQILSPLLDFKIQRSRDVCTGFNFTLGAPGSSVSARSAFKILVRALLPVSTPDMTYFTVSRMRSGNVAEGASVLGPEILGFISNITIELLDPEDRHAGGTTNLTVSFISPSQGNMIDILAIEPIGFDFRNSSIVGNAEFKIESRNRIRMNVQIFREQIVRFIIENVILPPFSGSALFNLTVSSSEGQLLSTTGEFSPFFVPDRIGIESVDFYSGENQAVDIPRFGDPIILYTIKTAEKLGNSRPGHRLHVEMDGFTNATVWICGDGKICGTVIPPLNPLTETYIHVHRVTGGQDGIVFATTGAQSLSLIGKLAERLSVNLIKPDRSPPNAVVNLKLNLSCTGCLVDWLDIKPPNGYSIISQTGLHTVYLAVRTPKQIVSDNRWTIIAKAQTESNRTSIIGWDTIVGFDVSSLQGAQVIYPALPSRQVPVPVLMAVGFRLEYSTNVAKTIKLTLSVNRFQIIVDSPMNVRNLPISDYTIDPSSSFLTLSLNDSLTSRDYSLSLMILGPPNNGLDPIGVEILDGRGQIIDAVYYGNSRKIQFGFGIAPARPKSLFVRDDQSSAIQGLSDLSAEERSEFQIAQLSSFREVFSFDILGPVKVDSISQILIKFPDRVRFNRLWSKIDPSTSGVLVSAWLMPYLIEIQTEQNSFTLSLNESWINDVQTDLVLSVSVYLPQTEPLPAFNFFTISFLNSSNISLIDYVFSGHTLTESPSADAASMLKAMSDIISSGCSLSSHVLLVSVITLVLLNP